MLMWLFAVFQVVFKPLLSHTGIQSQDTMPLCYRMYFGEHLSFSGTLDCLRADIVDSDTAKDRKGKRARRYFSYCISFYSRIIMNFSNNEIISI